MALSTPLYTWGRGCSRLAALHTQPCQGPWPRLPGEVLAQASPGVDAEEEFCSGSGRPAPFLGGSRAEKCIAARRASLPAARRRSSGIMLPGSLLCLLGGCLLGHWASGSDLNCPPQEYPHDGRCCNRCAPGLKVRSDCAASQSTVCEQCEARHFQSSWTKERHCTPHRSCDHNAGLDTRSPGDTKHNAECQCQQGMYCSSPDCQTCLNITACRPGEGVARKADNFSDTVCVPCEHGSFSNISSTSEPCRLWTSCETLGLVQKVPGTNRLDVACEPGHGRGRFPVLISVMAIIAASLVGLILFCLYQKGLQQHRLKQGPERLDPVEIVVLAQPQPPAVVMCMEHDERQDFPVQETLLGRQPVAQEDGKESRISEQERL